MDTDRIAISAHSLGTEPAMVMAVLDTDIKALVFNDYLCHTRTRIVKTGKPDNDAWNHITPLWHLIPGFLNWFDFPDLLAAVAPRHLLITEGGLTTYLDRIARAYDITGAPTHFEAHYYPRYENPEDRKYDYRAIPEGLTPDQWFEYANVDAPNHCFKENIAVPWLRDVLQ